VSTLLHRTAVPAPDVTARRLPFPLLQEACIAIVALLGLFLLGDNLGLLTNIVAMCILALSLNFILGQAGIASMGHAALFGAGGYAAGLFAQHVSGSPLLGLLVGACAGAVVALGSGALMLRSRGLTLVMLTIATAQLLLELANWRRDITGGDDGLTAFSISPLLGRFEFDFIGRTGYLYAVAVLLVVYAVLRLLVNSPFGLTSRAIRLDPGRVESLGGRVYRHLLAVYVIGGTVAGVAGALMVQTTRVASLSMLDFNLSASVLIMVVLGGIQRPGGAILGTITYMTIHHVASGLNPHHWLFVIGALLVAVMVGCPGGLLDLWDRAVARVKRRKAEVHRGG
jgi:branched-chain amino acid transport system permease protein